MVALMNPKDFRAFFRMNCPQYAWAMKNPNGNEMREQKHTDALSELLQANKVLLAYLEDREFNPMTLVYFYPELKGGIERGEELFQMATGIPGVTMTSTNEIEELVTMINEAGSWCIPDRVERARRVIAALKQRGYQCRLTPEGLDAGMNKMKYYAQGPGDYLDFVFAFHNALAAIEPARD